MKIGLNTLFLVPGTGGGMERFVLNMVNALARECPQHDYVVFTNRDNSGIFGNGLSEKRSLVSARFRPAKIIWEQMVLPYTAKNSGLDVLISFGNISPIFSPCPSIVVIHDLIPFAWPEEFGKADGLAARTLFRLSAKKADKIITVSQFSKNQITRRFDIDEKKITIIPEACAKIFRKPDIEAKKRVGRAWNIDKDYILAATTTKPHKNLKGLLEAFCILKNKHTNKIKLVITQTAGTHKEIIHIVRKMGLENNVRVTGKISDSQLVDLYGAARVFVYPSLYEGFGLPVLEAMACATPVVASNAASLPEVAKDAALLVDPCNPGLIAKVINELFTHSESREKYIEKGLKRAGRFSWEKSARALEAVITQVVGANKA